MPPLPAQVPPEPRGFGVNLALGLGAEIAPPASTQQSLPPHWLRLSWLVLVVLS